MAEQGRDLPEEHPGVVTGKVELPVAEITQLCKDDGIPKTLRIQAGKKGIGLPVKPEPLEGQVQIP